MELSWNEEFWSHPDVPLIEHLSAVGDTCKEFLRQARVNDKRFIRAAELVGKSHDFGKYSSFFQRHIRGIKVRSDLKEHSQISSLFSAWLIWRELGDDFLGLVAFICTLRHHGNLSEDLYGLKEWLEDNFGNEDRSKFSQDRYKYQIKSIRENLSRISVEMEKIGVHGVKKFMDELPEVYLRLRRVILDLIGGMEIENVWEKYFTLLLLYSALIDADRRDAGQLKEMRKRKKLDPNLVDTYRERKFKLPSSLLNHLRNKVYENTINSLSSKKIFKGSTVTAPTGIGKTLLALSIALKLREQIRNRTGHSPRIIYILPYINIIEQTYDIFSEVLDAEKKRTPPCVLLKHHHQYFLKELGEDVTLDEALLLIEAWESEIIISTFVQFFHTLIGGHKHFLRKFHNVFGSIIILDEVQTIPMEYWELVKKSIQEFVQNSGSIVIAMTATRPIIFADISWDELVPHYQEIYKNLDRVDYCYFDKGMEINGMVDWFLSEIWSKNPSSALIVLNTISSSIDAYRLIKGKLPEDAIVGLGEIDEEEKLKDSERIVLAYLSTNVVPAERQRRIKHIKDLLEKNRKIIVVSTKVIEAGVDLDFRVAIRDIGPIDSIIQVAGRCNRGGKEQGNVYIIRIKDGKFARNVYGSISILVSERLLEKRHKFSEGEILKIMNEYFEEAYKRKSHSKSEEVLNAVKRLDFSVISGFKLIEEEPRELVFIELDEKAKETLKKFKMAMERLQETKKLKNLKKIFESKVELRKARTELEAWIVPVWKRQGGLLPPKLVTGDIHGVPIYYVERDEVEKYYDRETGYILSSHVAIL